MQTMEFIWQNGSFKKWEDATTHVLTHTLHYGGGAFEGIRCYKTDKGPAIFRLEQHLERLHYSAKSLAMKLEYSVETISDAIKELVKKNKLDEGYIRPLVYFGYKKMGVNAQGSPVELAIACWPWGKYLAHDAIDVKTSKYIRIHPDSTIVDAKFCGHYLNSQLAILDIQGSKYHEALLLDAYGHVAEGPGENLFIVKDNKLLTPKLGTILPGLTRSTVIEMAQYQEISVEETELSLDDVYAADEAFFCGTAAEITPIRSVDDKLIADGSIGSITRYVKDQYAKIVRGEDKNFIKYLSYC